MNTNIPDHIIGLLVAAILAAGTGYFGFRLTMSAFQERVKGLEAEIVTLEEDISTLQDRRESLRIDLTKLDIKINALLRERGINPDNLQKVEQN